MNIYSMTYQRYERYGQGELITKNFEAPNDKVALLKADPWIGGGCGRFNIISLTKSDFESYMKMDPDEMANRVVSYNGDGMDFLMTLKNETTGKILFNDGCDLDEDFEDGKWDLPEDMTELANMMQKD